MHINILDIELPPTESIIDMKKMLIIVFMFLFASAVSIFSQDDSFAGPLIVRVGVYENPPKIFLDGNGRPDGLDRKSTRLNSSHRT